MEEQTETVLIVEQDPSTVKKLEQILSGSGYKFITCDKIEQAVKLADNNFIQIILMDVELFNDNHSSGAAQTFLYKINVPAVFIYSSENPEAVEKTRDITSFGYVMKNAADIILLSTIKTAIKLHNLYITTSAQLQEIEASNEELRATMEELEAINDELTTTQKSLAESEGKYRRLYESLMDAVIMIDMKGKIIESNTAFLNLIGYSDDELLAKTYMEITPHEWRQLEKSIYQNQLAIRGYSEVYEKEFIKKDGTCIPVEMRAYLFTDNSGNYIGAWAIVRDISERRKAAEKIMDNEMRLAETNYMLQLVLDTIPSRIFWLDTNLKYMGCNRMFAIDNGFSSPVEIIGLNDHIMSPPEQAEFLDRDNLAVIRSGEARLNYEEYIKFPNGPYLWLSTSKVPLRNMSGEIIGVLVTYENITERKQAIESLDRSEKILASLFNATPIGITLLIDRKIQKTNAATCFITGYTEEEVLGKSIKMMYPDEDEFNKSGEELYRQMNTEGIGIKEIHVRKKDGTIIDVLASIAPVDRNNPAAGVCVTITDITDQKKAVEALDRSEKILKSMLDSTPIGVALLVDRKFQRVNAAQCRITGYSEQELLGQSTRILYPDETEFITAGKKIYDQVKSEGMATSEVHIKRKDGAVIDALITGIPIDADEPAGDFCATVMDITERKKAEQALIKSENLLRNFLEEIMEGIAILDTDGAVTFWNNVCTVMTGIPSHEAMGQYWWNLAFRLEPDDMKTEEHLHRLEKLFSNITESDHKKFIAPVEVTIRRVDGSEALLERRIFPVRTMAGIQYAITILDITDKKYAELLKTNALKELEKSETRFRSIIQGSSDMIFILDRNGSFSYESPSVSGITGYPAGYFIGKSPYAHVHPDDYRAVFEKINQVEHSNHTGMPAEFRARKSDGSWIFLELLGTNQHNNPSINGIVLTVRDISERKLSEIALRSSENLFKTLLNTTPAGVALLKERIFQKVNNALCNITGYTEDELIGTSTRILYFNDEEYIHAGKKLYNFKPENISEMLESRIRKKDGTSIDVLLSQSPFDIKNINSDVCTTVLDITERKRIETALRENENEIKSLLDSAPIGIGMIRERKFIKVNKALCAMTGYAENELLDELTRKIYPSDDVYERVGIELYESMNRNGIGVMETSFLRKDETIRDIQLSLIPFDKNDLSLGQCATALDITERNRMERELRGSEEKYRSIYENMPLGFVRTYLDGRIIDINPAAIHMFGYKDRKEALEILGNNVTGIHISVEDRSNLIRDLAHHAGIKKYTQQMKRKDGSTFTASLIMKIIRLDDGEPVFVEGMVEDITERVKMQDILIQSEKMMTVAGLAAGMAHEINNPLGIIMQNAENAMHRLFDKLPGNLKAAENSGISMEQIGSYVSQRKIDNYLDAIHDAGRRAARIVSSMLQFSRMSESRFTFMNLNTLIEKALELAANDFDLRKKYDFKKIIITRDFGELPDIPCVETQIEQVLLNIFKNSAQAMNALKKEGMRIPEITITTRKDENSVRLEIQDNGLGMDEATRKRIFEPFFTTKQTGSGTGLGLSVSYYIIVNGHKGSIWADSVPGAGTKIVINLPLIKKENRNGQAYPYH